MTEKADKSIIKNLLTKPWNLYVIRHSALTRKSQFLTESNLRSHADWTASSKMPQVYIHLNGESNNAILERHGLITKEIKEKEQILKSLICPNCQETNMFLPLATPSDKSQKSPNLKFIIRITRH